MGFGINYESNGGGDIVPIVKFDAKAGRMFRVDRAQGANGYENTPHDITRSFKAVVDLENVEVGFMNFGSGGAPDFVLVPYGDPFPQRPSDQHKQGVRLMMKLGEECGGETRVREISTVAKSALRGFDKLHDDYLAGVASNPGKLPVVTIKDTIPITTGEGARRSTSYSPVFEIIAWAPRPADLVFKPKAKTRQVNGDAAPSPMPQPTRATPPATGSTQVSAPVAAQAQPMRELAIAEDFG